MQTQTHIHLSKHANMFMYTHINITSDAHTHIHTYSYTHILIYTHTHIHTYSYTHILKQSGLSTLLSIYQGIYTKLTVSEVLFYHVKNAIHV